MKPEGAQQLDWRNPWIYIIVGVLLSLVISPAHLVAFVFAAFFCSAVPRMAPLCHLYFLDPVAAGHDAGDWDGECLRDAGGGHQAA